MKLCELTVTAQTGATLLGPVSLEVPAPVQLLVVGPSGAGKSTLLLALAGAGGHRVSGTVEYDTAGGERGRVALAVQEASEAFTPYRRVGPQLLDAVPPLSREGWRLRMTFALASLGLPPSVLALYPHEASGGMLKRMLLAGLCCLAPDLLLLDEPTSGIDPSGRQAVWTLLAESGVPFVVATHDFDALRALPSASALLLRSGAVVGFGTAASFASMGEVSP